MGLTVAKYLGMVDRAVRVRRMLDGRGVDTMGEAAERNARLYELRVWVGDAKE